MNRLATIWARFQNIGIRSPKEIALSDLQEAQRMLLDYEKQREEAVAAVTMLRARISRLQATDQALR